MLATLPAERKHSARPCTEEQTMDTPTTRAELLTTEIHRYVAVGARPFRPAMRRRSGRVRKSLAISVWEAFVNEVFAVLTTAWAQRESIDLADSIVVLTSSARGTPIRVDTEGWAEPPHPMHLRSALGLIDHTRTALQREASISTAELDAVTNTKLSNVAAQFPFHPDPALANRDSRTLERIVTRRLARPSQSRIKTVSRAG